MFSALENKQLLDVEAKQHLLTKKSENVKLKGERRLIVCLWDSSVVGSFSDNVLSNSQLVVIIVLYMAVITMSQWIGAPEWLSWLNVRLWLRSQFVSLSPALVPVLSFQSLKPASDSVSLFLSAPPLLTLCLSLKKWIKFTKN